MLTPFAASGVSSSWIAPGTLRVDRMSEVLSWPEGCASLRGEHEEARGVPGLVLDVAREEREPVDRRRRLRADRRRAALPRREARRFRVAHDGDALRPRQPPREPALALREALRMRVDLADAGERALPAHQALPDRQHDLAAHLRGRREQEIERAPDRAFGGVLDRHHGVARRAGLHPPEHFVDRGARRRAAPRRRNASARPPG